MITTLCTSRSYLCDQLVKLESFQLKLSSSWPRSLHCLTLKHSSTESPDMFWDFHNKQVISIGGETNGGPDSKPPVLPYGEDYWQVGPIGKQWPSLGFEGQMIADRWKPHSPRKKQSGERRRWECGGLMSGGQHHGCYQVDENLV